MGSSTPLSSRALLALTGLCLLGGCALTRTVTVRSAPVSPATVLVDGKAVGQTPADLELRFDGGSLRLEVRREDSIALWPVELASDGADAVELRLEPDPSWGRTKPAEWANRWWLHQPVGTDVHRRWEALREVVAGWGELERSDREARYLRTAWRARAYPHTVFRTRVIARLGPGTDPEVQVRVENERALRADPDSADLHFEASDRLHYAARHLIELIGQL